MQEIFLSRSGSNGRGRKRACINGADGMGEVIEGRLFGTFDNGMGETEDIGRNLWLFSNYPQAVRGGFTSSNSWAKSSRASGSVSMMQCSCATRHINVASSKSLNSWTLSIRGSSAMRPRWLPMLHACLQTKTIQSRSHQTVEEIVKGFTVVIIVSCR